MNYTPGPWEMDGATKIYKAGDDWACIAQVVRLRPANGSSMDWPPPASFFVQRFQNLRNIQTHCVIASSNSIPRTLSSARHWGQYADAKNWGSSDNGADELFDDIWMLEGQHGYELAQRELKKNEEGSKCKSGSSRSVPPSR